DSARRAISAAPPVGARADRSPVASRSEDVATRRIEVVIERARTSEANTAADADPAATMRVFLSGPMGNITPPESRDAATGHQAGGRGAGGGGERGARRAAASRAAPRGAQGRRRAGGAGGRRRGRAGAGPGAERVADAPARLQVGRAGGVGLELLAEPADVD